MPTQIGNKLRSRAWPQRPSHVGMGPQRPLAKVSGKKLFQKYLAKISPSWLRFKCAIELTPLSGTYRGGGWNLLFVSDWSSEISFGKTTCCAGGGCAKTLMKEQNICKVSGKHSDFIIRTTWYLKSINTILGQWFLCAGMVMKVEESDEATLLLFLAKRALASTRLLPRNSSLLAIVAAQCLWLSNGNTVMLLRILMPRRSHCWVISGPTWRETVFYSTLQCSSFRALCTMYIHRS